MSNLLLNDNVDTFTLKRVAFNDSKAITNFNIVGSKDLIAKGDAAGNPTRLEFSLGEVEQSDRVTFQAFADRNAGLIVDIKFQDKQHFGYIESYNILAKRTKNVTREEPNPADPSELIITTADETFTDIDFSFVSLQEIPYDDVEDNLGLFLV